jgi:hypothetical protein
MPRLAPEKRRIMVSIIREKCLTLNEMAIAASCSIPTIVRMRENEVQSKTAKSSNRRGGKLLLVTRSIRNTLREHLSEHPNRYLEEIRVFLFNEFGTLVSASAISRLLDYY